MQGKIKWFSEEKGYGFITDEALKDLYFSIRDVIGSELPPIGAVVEFEPTEGKKGPRAHSVRIISHEFTQKTYAPLLARERDDRTICTSCGKKMVPRLITHQGAIQRSVCPFCANTFKDFGVPWHWVILAAILLWLMLSVFDWARSFFA